MGGIAELLDLARREGLTVSADRGDLLIKGPESKCHIVDRLRRAKPEILAALNGEPTNGQAAQMESAIGDREIDSANIVRPELIITDELVAIAIPSMVESGGRPRGEFNLFSQQADGNRHRRKLTGRLLLPDKRKLWIYPQPSEPTPNSKAGWSKESRLRWEQGEPPPDPADLFAELCKQFATFIEVPPDDGPGTIGTLVCWTVLSYVYPAWPAVPYLFVGGPLGSGKSRVFEILTRLVFRPLGTSNLTAASLFRTLHDRGGTLLLDEAERLKQTSQPDVGELLSALLAGYKKGGQATRLEPVKNGFKTVAFDVFGPKAMACIAGLPPALASRAIPVTMFRAGPDSDKPRRRIDEHPGRWQKLRDDLHRIVLGYGSTWLDLASDTDACPRMGGRDFELWQPLLAIAKWFEGHGCEGLHPLMVKHAKSVITSAQTEAMPEADATLLGILAEALRDGRRLTPAEILEEAMKDEQVLFRNWSPRGVTARLKLYGIPSPRKVMSRREFRDVTWEMVARIQEHYGLELDCNPEEH